MKKIFVLAVLFSAMSSFAQVKFKPGIRAGANFAKFSSVEEVFFGDDDYDTDVNRNFIIDFYAGVTFGIQFTKRYTLQPEINYSRQGGNISYSNEYTSDNFDYEISYLSMAVMNKLYPGRRFNIQIGPFLDSKLSANFDPEINFDLGIIAGVGYDITDNFGVEVRFKKGVPSIYGDYNSSLDNLVISVGAAYTFR